MCPRGYEAEVTPSRDVPLGARYGDGQYLRPCFGCGPVLCSQTVRPIIAPRQGSKSLSEMGVLFNTQLATLKRDNGTLYVDGYEVTDAEIEKSGRVLDCCHGSGMPCTPEAPESRRAGRTTATIPERIRQRLRVLREGCHRARNPGKKPQAAPLPLITHPRPFHPPVGATDDASSREEVRALFNTFDFKASSGEQIMEDVETPGRNQLADQSSSLPYRPEVLELLPALDNLARNKRPNFLQLKEGIQRTCQQLGLYDEKSPAGSSGSAHRPFFTATENPFPSASTFLSSSSSNSSPVQYDAPSVFHGGSNAGIKQESSLTLSINPSLISPSAELNGLHQLLSPSPHAQRCDNWAQSWMQTGVQPSWSP